MDEANTTFTEKIFRATKPTGDNASENPTPDVATQEPVNTSAEPTTKPTGQKETTAQTTEPSGNDAETTTEPNAETSTTKKKDVKPTPDKKLKVSFGTEPKNEEPPTTPTEPTRETASVDENSVLSYLKNEFGLEIKSLSDLTVNKQLPEAVEQFKKFNEETGRGIKDFYNLQRDWGKEDKDAVIKEYFRFKHPNLGDDDLNSQVDLLRVTEEDEDNLSERELKKRKLEFNKVYSDALSFLSQKSDEYRTPLDSQPAQVSKPSKEDIAKAHRPYWDARDNSLKQLNEISFNIEDVGKITLPVSDEDRAYVTEHTQTLDAFMKRFLNKDGKTMNTDRLVEDTLWSNPKIRQRMITSIIEQSQVLFLDEFSKKNRNVNLNDPSIANETESAARLVIDGDNSKKNDSKFGKPIFPLTGTK